jgi:hypothetical protein
LDIQSAKKADNLNNAITEKGKYFGRFVCAESVTSRNKTCGVKFSFVSDTGEATNYLTVWTHNAEMKVLYGQQMLMAIMTCLRVDEIESVDKEVEKYDYEEGRVVKKWLPVFPELMDRPIGLLLYMEEYQKNDGSIISSPRIFAPFDKDGFTASEILDKAMKPERLEVLIKALKDRPLKPASDSSRAAPATASPSASSDPFSDMDDDIPF